MEFHYGIRAIAIGITDGKRRRFKVKLQGKNAGQSQVKLPQSKKIVGLQQERQRERQRERQTQRETETGRGKKAKKQRENKTAGWPLIKSTLPMLLPHFFF